MPRIRTIKPDFCKSADVGKLSRDARLFFLQLLTEVDDCGRTQWLPKHLAGTLYPRDEDVSPEDVRQWAKECETVLDESHRGTHEGLGMVARYEHEGVEYLAIVNFCKHQKIDRPTPSKLPVPPWEQDGYTPPDQPLSGLDDLQRGSSESPSLARWEKPAGCGSGKGSGSGSGKGTGNRDVDARSTELVLLRPPVEKPPTPFERFWQAYPLKDDPEGTKRAWRKAVPNESPIIVADLMAGLARWNQHWADPENAPFIKYPKNWLATKKWLTIPPAPKHGTITDQMQTVKDGMRYKLGGAS